MGGLLASSPGLAAGASWDRLVFDALDPLEEALAAL
jgi:hypothetical protein